MEKTLLNEEDASLDSIWWRDLRKVCEGKSGVKWFYNGVTMYCWFRFEGFVVMSRI